MKNKTKFVLRFFKLMFGLFLFALGVIECINANIGYAPWDVFHVGLSQTTGLSLGVVSIVTGLFIIVLVVFLKEILGIGTILNMIFIGVFIDIINYLNFIPVMSNFWYGFILMQIGLLTLSIASYFYISAGFGAGPRDSLMVALARRTPLPIGICRSIVEATAVISGFFLGGYVGIGTVVYVLLVGVYVQLVFMILRFNPGYIKHESIRQTFSSFKK